MKNGIIIYETGVASYLTQRMGFLRRLIPIIFVLTVNGVFFFLSGCNDKSTPIEQDLSWDSEVKLKVLKDVNPDPTIIEVNLEAIEKDIELKPGIKTQMFTYNGIFPGPLIEGKIGDTLIVHFTNNLPEETTVHWHGVELPATMDGSNISQLPVAANGGTFTYQFKLLNAATYWYHPHVQTHRQVEKGLYGALVVRDPLEDQTLGLPEKELTLLLDDIMLDENDQVAPPYPSDPVEYATMQLNGRESIWDVLINGKRWPIDVELEIGVPIRLRLINAANSKFFRLSIPGHTTYRIGGDGGLLPNPIASSPINILDDSIVISAKPQGRHLGDLSNLTSNPDPYLGILLVPGERADVVFTPKRIFGDSIHIEWHDFPRGRHSAIRNEDGTIGIVHDTTIDGNTIPFRILRFPLIESTNSNPVNYVPPNSLKPLNPIDVSQSQGILPVTFGHSLPDLNGNITFFATMVNGVGKPFELLLPEEGLQAIVGGTYMWEVKNMTEGDHPFHPHGFTFQHIETEYVDLDTPENNFVLKAPFVENKDTIRVPGRPGIVRGRSWTTVRLATKFSDTGREGMVTASGKTPTVSTSGGWVVHCHILEHTNRGMMTFLNLTGP